MHSHHRAIKVSSLSACPTVHCIQYKTSVTIHVMYKDEVLKHQVTLRFTDASRVSVMNMQCGIQANVLCDGSERLELTSE